MLHAADLALEMRHRRVSVIEFGVANGAGLINLCKIAKSVTKTTGIEFDVYGFDTGAGMPSAIDRPSTFMAAGARSLPADVPQDPGWQTSPPTCYARPRRESAVVTQYERSDTC